MHTILNEARSPSLERLFHPRGVAVIGASADRGRIGGHPIHACLNANFEGRIYPVNPKHAEIQGLRCYPNVQAIDGPCDLAIVVVRAEMVPRAIEDCGEAGIPFAVVLAAGFKESSEDGKRIEAQLLEAAQKHGVRVVGPNCQGLVTVPTGLYAAFGSVADELGLRAGSVSAAFQSGGFGYAIVNLAEASGVGFRYCVSTGNETDITTPELLDYFLDDPGTAMAFGYIEGVSDGRALMRAGYKSLATGKPLLIWKGAKTDIGARAAASHTANLTGSYDVYRTAFRTSGILEINDVEEAVDLSRVFLTGRLPKGRGVGVLGISGGSGIVFADEAIRLGLMLPEFSEQTALVLKGLVPTFASTNNPADVTAGVFNDVSMLTETIDVVLKDDRVHQLVLMLASMSGDHASRAAEAIASVAQTTEKPILIVWSARRSRAEEAYRILEDAGLPIIPTPVRCAKASAALAGFAEARERYTKTSGIQPHHQPPPQPPALPDGPVQLNETKSKDILRSFDIPVTREVFLAADARIDVTDAAAALEFPVAVKVVSSDIAHKSDVGGVCLNVPDAESLATAVSRVVENVRQAQPDAHVEGVLVSEMAHGLEVLIGAINDPAFGPVVTLGLGGIFTEVLEDATHRLAPVSLEDARTMISELRASRLFGAYRGRDPLDTEALAKVITSTSQMALALRDRFVELDINPIFVRQVGGGVVAADAWISLR